MEQFLPLEIVEYIYKIKHQLEMKDISKEIIIHNVCIYKPFYEDFYNNIIFDGAYNIFQGKLNGYGIIVKKFKYHPELIKYKNYQVLSINGQDSKREILQSIKYLLHKGNQNYLSLKLRYNSKLVKVYADKH